MSKRQIWIALGGLLACFCPPAGATGNAWAQRLQAPDPITELPTPEKSTGPASITVLPTHDQILESTFPPYVTKRPPAPFYDPACHSGSPPEINFDRPTLLDPWGLEEDNRRAEDWLQRPRSKRSLSGQAASEWGTLSSSVLHQYPVAEDDPFAARKWHAEEAVRFGFADTLFFFGQVGAGSETASAQDFKVVGRYGVGCKLTPWPRSEVLLRGGPVLTYADPLGPERVPPQSEFQLEVQCKWPLLGPIKLEYVGLARPALVPTERRINHDVRFAFPLGGSGQLQVGARHQWENVPVPKPLVESGQLYFGLELRR